MKLVVCIYKHCKFVFTDTYTYTDTYTDTYTNTFAFGYQTVSSLVCCAVRAKQLDSSFG